MQDSDINTALLQHSAYTSLDSLARDKFCTLAAGISDWDDLITKAEADGLSNILYSHLKTAGVPIPDSVDTSFKALTARHQRSNRERTNALVEILDHFSDKGIDTILLKGMALIHSLYAKKSLRPMGDMDILVRPEQALLAQQALREIGYNAGDRKQGYLYDHHHLPVATRSQNGLLIQVEIHHDALSGDVASSITFDAVADKRRPISVEGRRTATLGHLDMLRHLCHHAFEPCVKIKLGAVADLYGYAARYVDEIDWKTLVAEQDIIINTLRCLHYLTPLPNILAEKTGTPSATPPSGIGEGFPPLTTTLNRRVPLSSKLKDIFRCADWWSHIYYQVPPERSLFVVRYFRHPARVGFWFYRRILASFKSRRH
jgi:hypothetical protein